MAKKKAALKKSANAKSASAKSANDRFPPQIKYIIGNEGCERFTYYGMRCILMVYMQHFLNVALPHATEVMHLFMGVCYLLPLFGSFLADRYWGRYKTILVLSLVYCLGNAVVALYLTENALYLGLLLICIGAGGIKPCVSAFVGDQFNSDQKHLITKVYNLFYWMINFGSTFSTLLTPVLYEVYGPRIAFGVPGILMLISTVIFVAGRKYYIDVPPSGHDKDSVWALLRTGMLGKHGLRIPGLVLLFGLTYLIYMAMRPEQGFADMSMIALAIHFFCWAIYSFLAWCTALILFHLITGSFMKTIKKAHPKGRVEEFTASMNVIKIFACFPVFWALFDQSASTWIVQAEKMNQLVDLGFIQFKILPSQMNTVNALFILVLIPIFTLFVYPAVEKVYKLNPLRKITWGMAIAAFSYVTVAMIQFRIEQGEQLHILWQIIPFFFITIAEILVSIVGLEFAFTQAPKSIKSTIMSFFLLTVFVGNLITVVIVKKVHYEIASGDFFMTFAVLMALTAGVFGLIARFHKMRDYLD